MASLAEVDLLKRQFLAALNHEVRTPLSGIMGMTALLEQTRLSPEQQEYVDLTKACVEELYQVLSSTLEFTALAAGETKIEKSDFLLHEMIEAVAAQWLIKARQKGLSFRLRLSDDLPETARGDEVRLRRILLHLLSNAVKFTENGEITLSASLAAAPSASDGFVLELVIEDTGIGIAEDQKLRIFESFEQLENGLARRYAGLGLGLTLARGLAKLMGGELSLASERGQGSRFSITVPLERSAIEHSASSPSRPAQAPIAHSAPLPSSLKSVLVVDDNEAARKVAEAFLKRGGFQVQVASSGEIALNLAEQQRFDLVLMDLQMPGMDGIETVTQLRGINGYEATPVLALTANVGQEYRQLCFSHGMQGYLAKPIDSELLLRNVRHFLIPHKP